MSAHAIPTDRRQAYREARHDWADVIRELRDDENVSRVEVEEKFSRRAERLAFEEVES
jgi:hypothetical protein